MCYIFNTYVMLDIIYFNYILNCIYLICVYIYQYPVEKKGKRTKSLTA